VDWGRLRPADDIKRNGLVGIAAQTLHFQIAVTGIEGVTQSGRGLGWPLKGQHTFVPCLAGEPVSLLAGVRGLLRRCADRRAIDGFAGFGAHGGTIAGTGFISKKPDMWIEMATAESRIPDPRVVRTSSGALLAA